MADLTSIDRFNEKSYNSCVIRQFHGMTTLNHVEELVFLLHRSNQVTIMLQKVILLLQFRWKFRENQYLNI